MKRPLIAGLAASVAVVLSAATAVAAPSWCPTAKLPAEKAICANAELGTLDGTMRTAHKRANFDSPRGKAEIAHEQKRWLGRRNLCGADVACLRKRYLEQIQFLESFFNN
ncbi:MAG: lysozyme inhibitor LprI family protein [Hyphomicrobiaceae bacterium]